MGGALLGGLLRAGWAGVEELAVVEPLAERRAELESAHPGLRTCATLEPGLLDESGGERLTGAVLAVKPDAAEGAARVLGASGVPGCFRSWPGSPQLVSKWRWAVSRWWCGPCRTPPPSSGPA